ncbi:hypothetical protein [Roseibium sp. Sym1]|uniref:hypothetical protein n=1 Tax=Roseibium sp. Sym1 TaxID=3016006 RepID=UPI0022B4F2CF|nr:hypothetical protein [Roseibium sp. Sym1]
MSDEPEGKQVNFTLNTTQEYLDDRSLSLDEIKKVTLTLARIFGLNYPRFFPHDIKTSDIDRMLNVAGILEPVEGFAGFKRHILGYSKESFDNHLFTAKTALWLAKQDQEIEFEPEIEGQPSKPDLKCTTTEGEAVYVECKCIMTDKYFDLDPKQELADLIYEKLPTCDQLNFYLLHENSAEKVRQLIPDKNFATLIFAAGMKGDETDVTVEGEFNVRVIRQPPIIGGEDDFLTVTMGGWLEDVHTGVRLPGFTFMRGGRAIAIHGPPPSYRKIFEKNRRRSRKQSAPGFPFITFIHDDDILGDPADHDRYLKDVWLTKEYPEFTGVALLGFYDLAGQGERAQFRFLPNPEAAYPLPAGFFNEQETDFKEWEVKR